MAVQYGLRRPLTPAEQVADSEPNEFQKGFRRFIGGVGPSIDRTQGVVQQALGFDEAAQANFQEARAAEAEVASQNLAPRIGRVEDIRTDSLGGFVEDAGAFAGSVLGENLPLLGGMAAGGIGGALAGRALGATKLGGFAGAAAPYEAVSVAESSRDIMDDPNATGTPQEQALGTLATGTAKTVLGMAPIGVGARMLRGPGGRLAKGAKVGGASAATEGVTEAGEEAIGLYGKSQYVPGTEMWDEEARSRYLNAAAGGAILGGPTGFAAGVLAPKRLSRAAEHAMQSASEEGRSYIDGANDFVNKNSDLFSDDELASLGPEIEGFQPRPARSRMEKAMADLEAREELDLAYSNVLGITDEDYAQLEVSEKQAFNDRRASAEARRQEARQNAPAAPLGVRDTALSRKMAGDVQDELHQTAYALIKGEITQEQAESVWPRHRLQEAVEDLTQRFGPETSRKKEKFGLDPGEQMQLDEQETKVKFLSNKKGLPWHIGEKEGAEKVAKNTLLDTLSASQRQSYENSTGKGRERWDKAIEEARPRLVKLRTKLLREASDEGVADVNTYMLARVQEEYLPALSEAEPGTTQHNKYLEYRNKPEAMLDDFGFLAKEDIPKILSKYGVDTIQPGEMGEQRSGDLRTEQAIRALDADIGKLQAEYDAAVFGNKESKEAYQNYRDRKSKIQTTPEQREQFFAIAEREAQPKMREKFEVLDAKEKERSTLHFKRQGIIEGRDNKSSDSKELNPSGVARIPVEVYDYDPKQKRMRWIRRQLNPMAAAIKAQREIPFDPDATGDVMMRQILDGLGAVLGSQKFEERAGEVDSTVPVSPTFVGPNRLKTESKDPRFSGPANPFKDQGTPSKQAIRLPIEINPETIMYQRSEKSGLEAEDRLVKWGDVQQWMKDKDEKKTSEWLPDDVPGIQGEEGIENAKPETIPLKPFDPRKPETSHTTTGGLAKDPGPYVFDLRKPKEPLSAKELPKKVISGGQTGADVGGLVGAQAVNIATGGTAPKGWRTQKGAQPVLGTRFGLVESDSSGYAKRTEQNVIEADLTFIFRPEGHSSPGTGLTIKLAKKHGKPFRIIDPWDERAELQIAQSIRKHSPRTINIAGPREESVKGIGQQVAYVLSNALEAPGDVVTMAKPATKESKAKAAEDKRSLKGVANKIAKKRKFTEPVEPVSKDPNKAFWQGIKEGVARKLANADIAQRNIPISKQLDEAQVVDLAKKGTLTRAESVLTQLRLDKEAQKQTTQSIRTAVAKAKAKAKAKAASKKEVAKPKAAPKPKAKPAQPKPIAAPKGELRKPVMTVQMSFKYDGNQRSDVKAETTFDAIVRGERTSTLRLDGWKGTDRWAKIKPGDTIQVQSGLSGTFVEITSVQRFEDASKLDAAAVSKTEGWNVKTLKKKYLPKGKGGYYIKYKKVSALESSEVPGVPKKDQILVDKMINAHDTQRHNRHKRLATKMAKQMGLSNIRVLDTKEAVALMVAVGEGDMITRRNGFSTRKGGESLIYVNPTLPEDAAIEVLGHEIGHVVLDDTWATAPKKLKKAVEKEFAAYLERVGADPTIYDVISKRTPQRLLERTLFDVETNQKISELPEEQQKYLLEFKEWFADNVAKWTVTDAKPRSLVDQFFKHVADIISDLWNSLVKQVNAPEKSVQGYMDHVFMVEPEKTFGPEHAFSFSEVPKGVSPETAAAASSTHGASWYNSDEAMIRQAMRELLTEPEINVLGNLVHKTHIRRQLSKTYGTDPIAMDIIDESRTDEMIVLLFKAWRAGDVNLSRRQESIFTRFMEKLAEVLGIIMQSKQGERLMLDISDGAIKREEADRVHYLQNRVNDTNIQQARQVIEKLSAPVLKWTGKIGGTAEMRVRWAKNSALTELWKQIYLSPDTTGGREGFFAATRRTRAFFERKMHGIFEGRDEALGEEVVRILNKEDKLDSNTEAGEIAQEVYDLLQEIRKFSTSAGVKMGFLGKDYFPRVYDMDVLVKNRDEFIDMLEEKYPIDLQEYYRGLYQKDSKTPAPTKTNREIAEFIHRNLTTHQGDELSAIEEIQRDMDNDPLGWPVLDASKARSLAWIENEDVAQYMSHDLGLTLSTYIYQASKRAEYNRRFGVGTGKRMVTSYLAEAEDKGASEDDMKMAHNAVKAALGTLGADINPTFHKWQGVIMVLENWMLLGLATLTSLVDPVGIAVRGDMETAWSSLKQGLSEVKAKMKGNQTDLSHMAGMLGINELHNTVEALGYEYGGYYVTGAARRWNERLFSINMLTQWTRMTRTMALAGARRFIGKHAAMDSAKSERFMAELGLRKGDVVVDENGNATILDDAEVENLQMSAKKSWDDKNLEKHFIREYNVRGELVNLDKGEVHHRFNNVDWDTAPKKIVESLLKQKESRIKWYEENVSKNSSLFFKDEKPFPIEEIRGEASTLRSSLRRGDKIRGKTRDSVAAQAEFERDERVRQALNRWVDEAILRPDAAQRPIWASDPHWMLVFHLKAFIYSFHERILRRVGHEIMEGNYMPAVTLMGYLPMMFIAEALRNTIQGDDMDEDIGKDAGFWETSHYMAQRAGLYGIGQFYFDAKQGWQYGDTPFSTLGGPFPEHVLSIGEAALSASTADDARVAMRSMPFHNVWKDYFK